MTSTLSAVNATHSTSSGNASRQFRINVAGNNTQMNTNAAKCSRKNDTHSHHNVSVPLSSRLGEDDVPAADSVENYLEAIALARRAATFVDRPYDQRLAAACVTGDEHARHIGRIGRVAGQVAAAVEIDTELFGQRAFRAGESHREQHELCRNLDLRAGDRLDPSLGHHHLDDA